MLNAASVTQVQHDASYDLKGSSFVTFDQQGHVRLFKVRDQKSLEITAQGSLKDNILRVLKVDHAGTNRKFLVITRQGGLKQIETVSFEYWLLVKKIALVMSQELPFKFGITPDLVMPGLTTDPDETGASFQQMMDLRPGHGILTATKSIRASQELSEKFESGGLIPEK